MSLRSLLIVAPGALLLIAALAFVFVNKDDGHGHYGHSHGAHSHDHDHAGHAHGPAAAPAAHNHAARHEGEDHSSHGGPAPQVAVEHSNEWREHYGDASLPLVWKSLLAAQDALLDGLGRAENLPGLTRYAETIHLTAHALLDQVALPSPAEQQRIEASLAQTAALADALLETLHHSDRHAAHATFSRLTSAIGVVKIRLPETIQSQAEQLSAESIFAPTPAHTHSH